MLALVGRLEVRDWIDVIECDARLQPLGYLAWAASGKDPGLGPAMILAEAARSSRYSAEEVAALTFDGPTPHAARLSRRWRAILARARAIVDALPPDQVGTCVLAPDGALCRVGPAGLRVALARGRVAFHAGRIRGALPRLVAGPPAPASAARPARRSPGPSRARRPGRAGQ